MDQNKINTNSRRTFLKFTAMSSAFIFTSSVFAERLIPFKMDEDDTIEEVKFLKACEHGDLETVQTLLDKDKSLLKTTDTKGRSGFALALLSGQKEVGQFLRDRGYEPDLHETVLDQDWDRYQTLLGDETPETSSKINADHPIGGSCMWAAASVGVGSSMWRVYSYCGNPNLNTKGSEGTVPLQQALRFPNLKVAELTAAALLSNDADPNPESNNDFPPLHIAVERGSIEMVEMLIRLGADVNSINNYGRSPMELADYHGYESIMAMLQNHSRIPRTCRTDRMAYDMNGDVFQMPDMNGAYDYIQSNYVGTAHKNLDLLKSQAEKNPNLIFSKATTSEMAIEAGAHMGRPDIVEFLAEKGAPYSLPTAVMMNDFKTVKRLLDEDPNRINARGAHDFALLWYPLIGGGKAEMMQLLLDRGAQIEYQHFLGITALHWACMDGNMEIIEMLLENGADINRSGRKFGPEAKTPIQMTRDPKIIEFLKSKGAKLIGE